MIDGVELVLLHQPDQVRKFHGDHPPGLSKILLPTKSLISGTRARTLLPIKDSPFPLGGKPAGQLGPEELHQGRHAFFTAASATLGRLNPQDGNFPSR